MRQPPRRAAGRRDSGSERADTCGPHPRVPAPAGPAAGGGLFGVRPASAGHRGGGHESDGARGCAGAAGAASRRGARGVTWGAHGGALGAVVPQLVRRSSAVCNHSCSYLPVANSGGWIRRFATPIRHPCATLIAPARTVPVISEKPGHRYTKGVGEVEDGVERDGAVAVLQGADAAPVQAFVAAQLAEALLREPLGAAETSESISHFGSAADRRRACGLVGHPNNAGGFKIKCLYR